MPRNKKNKNRAGAPAQQQQPAAKTTAPVSEAAAEAAPIAANLIADVTIAKTDVSVPVVAAVAVEAKPAVAVVAPAAPDAPQSVDAEKTSDHDDETVGLSKSQKKKKNKNKNKADKKEEATVPAAVAEVASKVKAEENSTPIDAQPQIIKAVENKSTAVPIDSEPAVTKTDVSAPQGKKNKKNKNKGKQNEECKIEEGKAAEERKDDVKTIVDTKATNQADLKKIEESTDVPKSEEKKTEEKSKTEVKKLDETKKQEVKKIDIPKSEETKTEEKTKIETVKKLDETKKQEVKKIEEKVKDEEKKIEEKPKTDENKSDDKSKIEVKKFDETIKKDSKKTDDKLKGGLKEIEVKPNDEVKKIYEKSKADEKKTEDKQNINVNKAEDKSKTDDKKKAEITNLENKKKDEIINTNVKKNDEPVKTENKKSDDKLKPETVKISQDKPKGNEKRNDTAEQILTPEVNKSDNIKSKEITLPDLKLENTKSDDKFKVEIKKPDDVKKPDENLKKIKSEAKKSAAQEIKQKDKKVETNKPETIIECPLEQQVKEIIQETHVDKKAVTGQQKNESQAKPKEEPTPCVKLPLESSITQPKENKPTCPIINQNIQSPDIASIWKILDPPKEEILHQKPIVDIKPTTTQQTKSEVKSSPPITPPVASPITKDAIKSEVIVENKTTPPTPATITKDAIKSDTIVEPKTMAATLVDAIKSETLKNVEIIKSVKDSPENQTPQPVSLDVTKKADVVTKTPPTDKCVQNATQAKPETEVKPIKESKEPQKLIEKSAAIIELPKIESKLVEPIVPLVTAAIIGTTAIVAEQCPRLAPIVTKIDTKEAPKSTVEPKTEPIVEVKEKSKADTAVKTNEKAKESKTPTPPESPKAVEPKPDDASPKTPTVKAEKTAKAVKTAAAKEKIVKEPKAKTSDKNKESTEKTPTKEPKIKTTKTKAKAPAPPSKETAAALQDVPLTASTSAVETPLLPANSGAPPQPTPVPAPIAPTESKNAAGSDSVQSVDVTAVLGSNAAESLQPAKPQEVNVTADVILSNDVNATFTISAKSAKSKASTAAAAAAAAASPADAKKPTEPTKTPPTAVVGIDATGTDMQLTDVLSSKPPGKESPAVKPGAVVGNVRTKAPKVPAAKSTGTIPKTTDTTPKAKQGTPPKDSAPKPAAPKGKQASPPKDTAPTAHKANARKTPPRNATQTAAAPTANKSRSSPHKDKSPPQSTATPTKPLVQPRPANTKPSTGAANRSASSASSNASNSNSPSPNPPYDDEEYVEFKFSPRPVYMSTICQVCKIPLPSHVHCKLCQMVSYCSVEHLHEDAAGHQPLCVAIQEIAKKRGGHVYNNARILNDDDYRSLRVHTLNLCENALQRHLQPFEREILLFPRLCATGTCREWRQQLLTECKSCGQVSYCAEHANHLAAGHARWCQAFALYQKLVFTQKKYGRIEPALPSKIMNKAYQLPATMDETFKSLYKNYGAIKDDCTYAALTQLATAPLTAYYGLQRAEMAAPIGDRFTIHLVGAELQFEADTLDKWETFFLHLVPQLVELRVTFVGPELNAENLPLEILSRIRMCRTCRQNCRAVKFDFQCGQLYHNYATSSAFVKPDLICFFNPGLYRSTGFNGDDTWPETIRSAAAQRVPIVVTSYTEVEAPRDLERLQREAAKCELSLVLAPHVNPFASQRPERNFISDEVAPMIFKNYYCFVCK